MRLAVLAVALLSLTGCAVPVAVWTAAASGLTATGVILNADVSLAKDYLALRGVNVPDKAVEKTP